MVLGPMPKTIQVKNTWVLQLCGGSLESWFQEHGILIRFQTQYGRRELEPCLCLNRHRQIRHDSGTMIRFRFLFGSIAFCFVFPKRKRRGREEGETRKREGAEPGGELLGVEIMSKRKPCSTVFVGNIFYDVTEDMLVKLLSEVGPVKSFRLVLDKETNKPKGFGFCEFYDVMTAESAVRNLNSRELAGRTLRVDFADEGTKGGPDSGSGSGSGRQVGREAAEAAAMSVGGQKGDEVAKVLATMTKKQLWDLLEQTKLLVQQNPQQARLLLIKNPALTKAVFQAQIILGIIKTQEPEMRFEDPAQMNTQAPYHHQHQHQHPGGMNGSGMQQPMMMQPMPPQQAGISSMEHQQQSK